MATDLGRAKSTAANKYDAFVADQLTRAESRIRLLDLTAGLLGFAALSLAYVVAMVLCDSKLMFSQHSRQLALYFFLSGGFFYLLWAVFRPLWLRVNPYYAARQVEQQLAQAKNSIVNWVDLHERQLPPAIRGALGQRAAKDLAHVDLDRAISGRRAAWMGGLAALFGIVFIASFFLLGPAPFLSLLKRTFNPFGVVGVSTRTQLTIRKPEGGNATVTVGRGISFVVEVNGKVPNPRAADAVKLLYRYEEGDPWLERPLIQELSREWTTSLSAIEVRNGFWYKISGGDAATEEYQVAVRAAPAITDFLATYHFRPYVARADEVRRERELKELCGTEVLLRMRANRALRDGRLELQGKSGPRTVRAEVDPNDARTLFVRFVLEEDGKYRLYFTSTESEAYSDPIAYPVTANADQPPVVELTKPGHDIRLPTDALLRLEGKASDDIGVKALTLRMRVVGGDQLHGQPYRGGGEALRLADGGYPLEVEYEDFVDLSRVQSEDGQAVALRAGMKLEYWLEASDACDYQRAHVAKSKPYLVLLTEPEKNAEKRQQEKQQAAQEKKQHEQKQDQKLQQENKQRQQERQEQEARNQEEENKSKDADKGTAGDSAQPKEGEPGNNDESKDNKGQKGESKEGAAEQKNGQQKGGSAKEDQKIEEQIKKALERREAGQDAKAEDKPDKGEAGEAKGAASDKAEGSDNKNGNSEGENKGAGKQDGKQTGESKHKGQPQAGADPSKSDGKGDNKADPRPGDKSEPKNGDPMKQNGASGSAEGKGKPDSAPKSGADKGKSKAARPSGEGKPSGDSQARKDAAQDKPQPMGQGKEAAAGDSKPADGKDKKAAAGEAKDEGGAKRSEAKNEGGRKDHAKTEAKQGNSASKGGQSAAGDAKSSSGQDKNEKSATGESKPDADAQARKATEKEIQELAQALDGKDSRQREKAKQQLKRIEKQAANPDVREKASETLEKFGEPDGSGSSGEPKNEAKDGDGSPSSRPSGSEKSDNGRGSDDKNGQSGPKGRGSSPGRESQGNDAAQGGTQAGGGGERRSGQGDAGRGDEGMDAKSQPAKPGTHRAAQMQLEDFAKKVNKDILKDAGVSEKAWKKYLESKRKQLTPRQKPRPDNPGAPQQANKLPSMGGRTIQPSASGEGDTHGPDRGQPPPGYRDPFREFTKQMSKKN